MIVVVRFTHINFVYLKSIEMSTIRKNQDNYSQDFIE